MGIKTILVEDNKAIRDAMVPTLSELGGMEVLAVVESAEEVIAAMERLTDCWELAVVDLFLKQGSGLDVLRACGLHHHSRVVVVLSNYATPRMREECRALGADEAFDKSTQLDAFFEFCASQFPGRVAESRGLPQ
jgi:DNA-binding NarL/FixJ family response regulator